MCLVIVRFLGLALPWGPALRLPDAHRLCPLADSLVGAVNSVGAGQNALCHLLNVSSLISGLSHLPFSVAGIFFSFFNLLVQSLSRSQLFVTPRTVARQASLSFTISQSLLKLMSMESVMPANHLVLCHPLLLRV